MYTSQFAEVHDSKMHFIEAGTGDNTILFLHGVPTSCYVWRKIIPHLSSLGRCIAPDLIGFGRSDKPNINYSAEDHIRYIEKLIDVLDLKNITLVMHGWGSVIGLDYAMRHENNCKGLAFYEAFLHSLSDTNISLPFQEQLITMSGLENSTESAVSEHDYVNNILPQLAIQQLTHEDMIVYREPFANDKQLSIKKYFHELVNAENKNKLNTLIENYSQKLMKSQLPKLMLYSIPGFITTIATVMWAKENLPNIEIADIGEELHLAQESNPDIMGKTLSAWLQGTDISLREST